MKHMIKFLMRAVIPFRTVFIPQKTTLFAYFAFDLNSSSKKSYLQKVP